MNRSEKQLIRRAFPTWCWILEVNSQDQPLLQEILSCMLDNDLLLTYWEDQDYYRYFNLLVEDQGELAGIREHGYWVLTKYLKIASYEEYLDNFDTIRKYNFLNLNNQ